MPPFQRIPVEELSVETQAMQHEKDLNDELARTHAELGTFYLPELAQLLGGKIISYSDLIAKSFHPDDAEARTVAFDGFSFAFRTTNMMNSVLGSNMTLARPHDDETEASYIGRLHGMGYGYFIDRPATYRIFAEQLPRIDSSGDYGALAQTAVGLCFMHLEDGARHRFVETVSASLDDELAQLLK